MSFLSRRETIIGGFAFAGMGLAARGAAQPVRGQGAASPDASAFFTLEEARFVEAAVDRLIPPDPSTPGALEAGCARYIDLQLAGPFGQGDRMFLGGPHAEGLPQQGYQLPHTPAALYRLSIGHLVQNGFDLAAMPEGERDAALGRLELGEVQIGDFSAAIFFETLLTNTIEGFFADPSYGGNKDMAGWRMVGFPGAYAAYVELYTQHGMQFDQPPVPMSEAAPHGGPGGHAPAHHHHGGPRAAPHSHR